MTKKDYIIIADAIAKSILDIVDSEKAGIDRLIYYIKTELYQDNSSFDGEKFDMYINKRLAELKN